MRKEVLDLLKQEYKGKQTSGGVGRKGYTDE